MNILELVQEQINSHKPLNYKVGSIQCPWSGKWYDELQPLTNEALDKISEDNYHMDHMLTDIKVTSSISLREFIEEEISNYCYGQHDIETEKEEYFNLKADMISGLNAHRDAIMEMLRATIN